MEQKKLAYVVFHSPRFHYLHKTWVSSLGAEFLESDYFSFSPTFFWRMLRRAWKNRNKYNKLVVVGGSGLQLATFVKVFNPRVKMTYLNIDPLFYELRSKNFLKKAYLRWLASHIDAVISNSQIVENQIKKYVNRPMRVVRPFMRSFKAGRTRKERFDNLIFLGRMNREKQPRLAMETFAKVKKQNPKATLTMIGDGPLLNRLKQIAPEGVNFTGYVRDPFDLLAKGGILVQPSTFESFGLSVFEAIHAGLIPIVSNTIGVAEHLPKELAVNNSAQEIADKILALQAKGPAFLNRLNKKLQNRVKQFNKENSVAEFKKAFGDISG